MHTVSLHPEPAALRGSWLLLGLLAAALLVSIGCPNGENTPPPPMDSQPPTAPANLVATANGATEIDLSWTASTDNVGVTGYRVESCQGAGCSNFAQIATLSGTTFNNTGLTASTSYSYRVRATDAASNLSGFSGTATRSTGAAGAPISVVISPKRGGLTLAQTLAFTAAVTNDVGAAGVTWTKTGGTFAGQTATSVTFSSAAAGSFTVTATSVADNTKSASATIGVTDLAGVFTHHNDNARTGQNLKELALTPALVNSSTFGKLFSCPVDGFVYAQPLYAANLMIGGVRHNVVFVATEHDSVYAFDADSSSCNQLWNRSFLSAGVTTVPAGDTLETNDLIPEIGITSTPVIDIAAQTLYVVPKTKETVGAGCSAGAPCYVHRLHALNLITGAERPSSPVVITAPNFNQLIHMQRPSLLLNGTTLYIAFGSHGDRNFDLYHGWLMGYDKTSLAQTFVWITSDVTLSTQGAIWQSGAGPAADSGGNVYVETANGSFDGGPNYGDSVVKLSAMGAVLDYFTPTNQDTLRANDVDLGSAGVVILPDQVASAAHPHLALGSGKPGFLYLLDQDDLGKFSALGDQVVQKITVNPNSTQIVAGIFGQPAYWNGNIYAVAINDFLKQFTISNGVVSSLPVFQTANQFTRRGAVPAVSANGTSGGIVWALDISGFSAPAPALLYALDARNVSTVLFTSPSSGAGAAGLAVKFTVPTVANGKVYVGTQTELTVFGLLPN